MSTSRPRLQVAQAKGICGSLGRQPAKVWLAAPANEVARGSVSASCVYHASTQHIGLAKPLKAKSQGTERARALGLRTGCSEQPSGSHLLTSIISAPTSISSLLVLLNLNLAQWTLG